MLSYTNIQDNNSNLDDGLLFKFDDLVKDCGMNLDDLQSLTKADDDLNDDLFSVDDFLFSEDEDNFHKEDNAICNKRSTDDAFAEQISQIGEMWQDSTTFEKKIENKVKEKFGDALILTKQTLQQETFIKNHVHKNQDYYQHYNKDIEQEISLSFPVVDINFTRCRKRQKVNNSTEFPQKYISVKKELISRKKISPQAISGQNPICLNPQYFKMLDNLRSAMRRTEWSRSQLMRQRASFPLM